MTLQLATVYAAARPQANTPPKLWWARIGANGDQCSSTTRDREWESADQREENDEKRKMAASIHTCNENVVVHHTHQLSRTHWHHSLWTTQGWRNDGQRACEFVCCSTVYGENIGSLRRCTFPIFHEWMNGMPKILVGFYEWVSVCIWNHIRMYHIKSIERIDRWYSVSCALIRR